MSAGRDQKDRMRKMMERKAGMTCGKMECMGSENGEREQTK